MAAAVMLFGGIETTEGMISNAILHLLSHPGQLRLVIADRGLVDRLGGPAARDEPAHGIDELRPAGVVERDVQQELIAAGRLREGLADGSSRVVRQLVEAAEEADPDALLLELGRLAPDRLLEEGEQAADLVVRAGPVLAAEGIHGDDRDAPPDRVAEEGPDRLDAGGMAFDLGQPALASPAAIAVHDDRDVAREIAVGQQPIRVGGRNPLLLPGGLATDRLRRRRRVGWTGEGRPGH